MNRSQTILAAIGGVVLVAALAIGYFIWDASSVSAENSETLDDSMTAAGGILRKLPVKPVKSELKVYDDSCAAYEEWQKAADKFASRGDLVFDSTTPGVFKSDMVAEARRLADRPGVFDGKLVKGDFSFGFKDYILGSAMPPGDAVKLAKLQREWNDVSSALKLIADCGASGLIDVRMGKAGAKAQEEVEEKKTKSKSKKSKAKAKAKAKSEGEGDDDGSMEFPAVTSFTVEFLARPSALVKTVNAFTTSQRFTVLEDLSFVREHDELTEALGGGAKKQEQSGSRRRRRQQQAEEAKPEAGKHGAVTDPATASPLKVTMALSVYDFGSLAKAKAEIERLKAENAGEEKEKGDAKSEGGAK